MRTTIRLIALAAVAALFAGGASHAGGRSDGRRFDATFVETTASVTNRVADLGTSQLIATGTGSVGGYGRAAVVVALSQDRAVHPCGAGSRTIAGLRRITVARGTLVLREIAFVCGGPSDRRAIGTWEVESASSSGAFAGADGRGEVTADPATRTATLTGKLTLADGSG
jgi:hypothetical protein